MWFCKKVDERKDEGPNEEPAVRVGTCGAGSGDAVLVSRPHDVRKVQSTEQ